MQLVFRTPEPIRELDAVPGGFISVNLTERTFCIGREYDFSAARPMLAVIARAVPRLDPVDVPLSLQAASALLEALSVPEPVVAPAVPDALPAP